MNASGTEMRAPRTADLVEVFSGIQGEGLYVGCRQAFVRFAGCNLRCRYCDTRHAWDAPAACAMEREPGSRTFDDVPNPVPARSLEERLLPWVAGSSLHHSVALTGGEPLLHADFLAGLLPRLRESGARTYLETNGTMPEALAEVVGDVDLIAMDIKLLSATGEEPRYEANRRFLEIARRCRVFVKIVFSRATDAGEVDAAARLVAAVDRDIPLVLQPVTPRDADVAPTPGKALVLQAVAAGRLGNVRVIPQTHKLTNWK